MRIGITMRVVQNDRYSEERDALSRDWLVYLSAVLPDATILPLCNQGADVVRIFREFPVDGVILSNGNAWGEAPVRDESEAAIIAWCRRTRVPILGVCRGLQVIQMVFGGRVRPLGAPGGSVQHAGTTHPITILPGTRYAEWVPSGTMVVNSYHDLGVGAGEIASPLRPFALSADGVIEGCFHPEEPIVAIQWHPERSNPSASFDRQLLRSLFSATCVTALV